MKKICLVGPIGAGKTTYLNHAKNKGIQVFECDSELRDIGRVDNSVVKQIKEIFFSDEEVENPFPELKNILTTVEKLGELEKILHPPLEEKLHQWFSEKALSQLGFVEAPLVFEIGWDQYFDEVWYIESWNGQEEKQFNLKAQEKKWPKPFQRAVKRRLMDPEVKKNKCTRVIKNMVDFDRALKEVS